VRPFTSLSSEVPSDFTCTSNAAFTVAKRPHHAAGQQADGRGHPHLLPCSRRAESTESLTNRTSRCMGVDTEDGRSGDRVRCHRTPFRSNFQQELQLIANLHAPWAARKMQSITRQHRCPRLSACAHSQNSRDTMKPHLGWPRCRYAD
jgi:hypothetical protein